MGATTISASHVGIVGAGTMGAGIAVSCLANGLAVTLIDSQREALGAGQQRISEALEGAVRRGKLTVDRAAAARARLVAAQEFSALAGVNVVIEAVYENLALKQQIFRALDKHCAPGTLLATNTSTLDIEAIAAATARPSDVVGMHFFSPAHIMRLVEIVRAPQTSRASVERALALSAHIGKVGVVVGNCFGFVGNRMLYAYGRENQLMLLEGVAPERIDAVLEAFGMAMGPNAVGDLAGLDVGYRVRRERKDLPADARYYRVADLLVEQGRLGQKSGRGMYRYSAASRGREVDPEVAPLIRAEAARLQVPACAHSDEEILERCLYALINEGAAILAEGIAAAPADIDTIWCNGYGFPRERGGPMAYADSIGLARVVEAIRRLAIRHGARYWFVTPLLGELAAAQGSFSAWQSSRADHPKS